ncbi:MAG: hypothetical protein WCJ19_05420 [bacterium]
MVSFIEAKYLKLKQNIESAAKPVIIAGFISASLASLISAEFSEETKKIIFKRAKGASELDSRLIFDYFLHNAAHICHARYLNDGSPNPIYDDKFNGKEITPAEHFIGAVGDPRTTNPALRSRFGLVDHSQFATWYINKHLTEKALNMLIKRYGKSVYDWVYNPPKFDCNGRAVGQCLGWFSRKPNKSEIARNIAKIYLPIGCSIISNVEFDDIYIGKARYDYYR